MADKLLKSIKFPTLPDRYVIGDTTLTEEGAAAEAKAVGEALATKADTKGTYEDLIVGGAEQLMADGYETDTEPYLFRTTGGSADVGNREYLDEIVGGTVAWNQLCNGSSVTVQSGHKYLLKQGTAWSIGASTGTAITGLTSGSDIVIDLTAMFGSTIADYIYSLEQSQAGAGVAWFRQYFPKGYYPYDPGTLRSVEGVSAHETVGKNLVNWTITEHSFDDNYNGFGQGKWQDRMNIPSSWHGKTLTYSVKIDAGTSSNQAVKVWFYKDGTYLPPFQTGSRIGAGESGISSITITVPSSEEANQIAFGLVVGGGSLVSNPQVELGTTATAYEPYTKHTYPLDSSLTLRGVPKLVDGKLAFDGDVYPPSGEVQRRYGIVDLGTLTWTKSTMDGYAFYSNSIADAMPVGNVTTANVVCAKYDLYMSGNGSAMLDKTYRFGGTYAGTKRVTIRDDSYTDAATFKSAMSGVMLVYEKATPTTETADSYEQYQICDPSGTEEFVTTGIVPVGHETRYPHDLKKKIETAPDSPSADGTYLMKRSGGKNTYMALPSTPSANGAYVLTVTVSGGTASYSWTAKE